MRRLPILAVALSLAACAEEDPFVEVEEAWSGRWQVDREQSGEGCEALTTIEPRWPSHELALPNIDGTHLEAIGCDGRCDQLPWLLMPLEEASVDHLFGTSSTWTFFAGETGGGVCDVQTGRLEAELVDGRMTLDLLTYTGDFPAGSYDECETIAYETAQELCTDSVRIIATR